MASAAKRPATPGRSLAALGMADAASQVGDSRALSKSESWFSRMMLRT
jgi:hypothetical protein